MQDSQLYKVNNTNNHQAVSYHLFIPVAVIIVLPVESNAGPSFIPFPLFSMNYSLSSMLFIASIAFHCQPLLKHRTHAKVAKVHMICWHKRQLTTPPVYSQLRLSTKVCNNEFILPTV